MQYLNVIGYIGLEDSSIARIVLGTSYDFLDIIAYTIGVIVVFVLDKLFIASRIQNY